MSDPNRYQIENQVEMAFQKKVPLPSGGTIVIEETEALVAIDVNSGRDTQGLDLEATAFNTNIEAVTVAAREIIKRDLSGIIVFDFIDMSQRGNQRKIEETVQATFAHDRARTQYGSITRFGTLQMSRQRLRPSLREGTNVLCPRCQGEGTIRNIDSLALTILRRIREYAMNHDTAEIRAEVPVAVASYLLNEKRHTMVDLERQREINIVITPNHHLETPLYEIERLRYSDIKGEPRRASYDTKIALTNLEEATPLRPHVQYEKPAVQNLPTPEGKPMPSKPGLLKKLWSNIFAASDNAQAAASGNNQRNEEERNSGGHRQRHRNNRNGGGRHHSGDSGGRHHSGDKRRRDNRQRRDRHQSQDDRSQDKNQNAGDSQPRQQKNDRRKQHGNHSDNRRHNGQQRRQGNHRDRDQQQGGQRQSHHRNTRKRRDSQTPDNSPEKGNVNPQYASQDFSQKEPTGYEPQLPSAAAIQHNESNYSTPLTMQELKNHPDKKKQQKTARSRRTSRGARGTTGRKGGGSSFSAKKSLPSRRSSAKEGTPLSHKE